MEFFGRQTLASYVHLCDNESATDTSAKCLEYEGWYPNDTLSSDWDVIQQIEEAFRAAITVPTMEHIKSHQDKNRAIETLPLKAQLNCKADKLAGSYMKRHQHKDHSKVLRFPVNLAQLHLPKGTCTYKLPRTLRHLRNEPAVYDYLIERNSLWDEDTPDLVDWVSHGRAVNRMESHKPTIVKLLFELLPVGTRVHRDNPKYDHHCPRCGADHETATHVYRCPHDDVALWRATMQKAISQRLRKDDSDPYLLEIALDGLTYHFEGRYLHPWHYPERYRDLVVIQNHIGWDNFMKGRLAKEWAKQQDSHLNRLQKSDSRKNGTVWATNLAAQLLQQWWNLWEDRNHARHGRDKEQQWQKKQEQLQREVELLYEKADELPPDLLDHIFRRPLEEQMAKSPGDIKAWLANWLPVVEKEELKQQQLRKEQRKQQQREQREAQT